MCATMAFMVWTLCICFWHWDLVLWRNESVHWLLWLRSVYFWEPRSPYLLVLHPLSWHVLVVCTLVLLTVCLHECCGKLSNAEMNMWAMGKIWKFYNLRLKKWSWKIIVSFISLLICIDLGQSPRKCISDLTSQELIDINSFWVCVHLCTWLL